MINIQTKKECGKMGLFAKDGMLHKLTNKDNFQEKMIGRSSCARLCYSRSKNYDFYINNPNFELLINCSHNSCWKPFSCYHWSYDLNSNVCYLHTEKDFIKIEDYEERAKYGRSFSDFLTVNGETGCLTLSDVQNPYILVDGKIFDVPDVCTYLHSAESNLTEITKSQCYSDFLYREIHHKKEEELLDKIVSKLNGDESRSKRFSPTFIKRTRILPAILQWFTKIMKSKGSIEMISPKTTKDMFNSFTLDKIEMLKALMSAMTKYGPKLINKQILNYAPLPTLNIMKNIKRNHKSQMKNDYSERVKQNLQWKTRKNMTLKSLKAMMKRITTAKSKSSPLTKSVASELKEEPYVFGSHCIEGKKIIQRIFMKPETIELHPNNQYIAVSLNESNSMNQGPVMAGHYQTTNMKELSCMTALAANESLPNSCFLKESEAQAKYYEYKLYTKGHSSSLIIRITAKNKNV